MNLKFQSSEADYAHVGNNHETKIMHLRQDITVYSDCYKNIIYFTIDHFYVYATSVFFYHNNTSFILCILVLGTVWDNNGLRFA